VTAWREFLKQLTELGAQIGQRRPAQVLNFHQNGSIHSWFLSVWVNRRHMNALYRATGKANVKAPRKKVDKTRRISLVPGFKHFAVNQKVLGSKSVWGAK
jgi:hypothetical protein